MTIIRWDTQTIQNFNHFNKELTTSKNKQLMFLDKEAEVFYLVNNFSLTDPVFNCGITF